MEISQSIIEDLLPLYLADEVSPETRSIMDTYIESDVKLAKLVEQSKHAVERVDIPAMAELDDEMKLFRKAQRKMLQEHRKTQFFIFLGLSIFFTLAWLLVIFFELSRLGFPTFLVAAGCWAAVMNINWQMSESHKKWFSE